MPFDFVDKGRYDERYRYEEGALARERRRAENEKRIREHNQRRDARLLQITFDIVQQVATEADFSYLESNIVFWSNILLQVDANTASYFINNQSQLSIAISNHLQGILSKLQLKCFVFTDDFLSKSNLLSLFGFIQCQHVNTENSLFFNQFSIFVQKLKENEVLTRDEILCLHRMILDHQDSQDFID
ncbi:MAG: hypothetical protein LRY69_06895, partial [Gammaproteobacteria bacterium]|nr:hypothetical protein [Gammaproteobacteria bacterium]